MRRFGPRFVLASGILLGVVMLTYQSAAQAYKFGMDSQVYYYAARASLAGGNLYAASPPAHPAYGYVYPPITILAFYPFALVGDWLPAFALYTAVELAFGAGSALLIVRYVESRGYPLTSLDFGLVAGYVLLSIHTVPSLFYGETNLHLLFALTLGFVALERGDEAVSGVSFGLAALFKVFPAAVGVWLLRRRAIRAIGVAVATGGGLLAVDLPLFGVGASRTWFFDAVVPRLNREAFAGGLPPGEPFFTIRRPLSVLLPTLDPTLLAALAFALLAPVVAYCYVDLETPANQLVAMHATMVAVLLFFPSFLIYYVLLAFPLVPLLYTFEGRGRTAFLAGAAVANLPMTLVSVQRFVAVTPLPSDAVNLAEPVLTVGTPPLYGCLLMLVGCVWHARR